MSGDAARKSAGIGRRFGAMLYDSLILVGILVVATFPFLPCLHGKVLPSRAKSARSRTSIGSG